MNIYDEAKEKLATVSYVEISDTGWTIADNYGDEVSVISKALERAKKEHELLELYRQYKKARNDKHVGLYTSLALQIETLEEELK